MTKTPKNIIDEQKRLEPIREKYESLKSLCTSLSNPGRSDAWDYYAMVSGEESPDSKAPIRRIYDPTAFQGLETWTNGIMGHFMPKEINWFALEMADRSQRENKVLREWLQNLDDHYRYVLNQSNYYEQKRYTISDSGSIGDSYLMIDQDPNSSKLICLAPHPREFWLSRDYWGRVQIIHHKFTKTLANVKEEFGDRALNEQQRLALVKNPYTHIDIIHGVYRNKDYSPDKAGTKNMVWQHYYVNVSAKIMMRETGSYTIHPIPQSLNRPSHCSYGYGIVAQMLIEILTCNYMSKDMLIASQIAARPPMLYSAGIRHKIDFGAGGKTPVTQKEMMGLKMGDLVSRVIDSSGYPFGADNQRKWQDMVRKRFGSALFEALTGAGVEGYKNIPHIQSIKAETVVLMAPFLGTLGTNTDLEFERIHSLEKEAGRAPEPPAEFLDSPNQQVDIGYIGPLMQLLNQYYETGNLMNTIINIQAVLSVKPDAAIVVEGDELMRKILRSGNTPEKIILSPEEVQEIRAIAAQQQEQEMLRQTALDAAKTVPNISKKIEDDSVLSSLIEAT